MRGLNIDINRSLSTQSSDSESNFVESSHKNEGLLHSLACVAEEISKSGSDNIQNSDSKVYKSEKTDAVLHQVGAGCGDPSERIPPGHLLKMGFKDDPKSNFGKRLSSDIDRYMIGNSSGKSVSNQNFVNMKCDERSPDIKEHSICMLKTPQEKSFNAPSKQQSADVSLLGTLGLPRETTHVLQKAILKDATNIGKSCFNRIEIELNEGKGKERIARTVDRESFSKGQNDSYESVDSISSKKPISLGKRASCFDMDSNSGCTKRFKGESDEVSFSRPVVHPGGSFFNWISSVANGIPRNGSPEISMAVVPSPLRDGRMVNSLTPLPRGKDEDLDSRTGFGSFIKTLYHPGLEKAQAAVSAMHGTKYGVHHMNVDQSTDRVGHNRDGFMVLQPVPLSVLRFHDYQLADFSPENVRNSTSSHSPFPGTSQHVRDEHHNMCNWGSTSSSTQNCSLRVPSKSSSSRFSSSRSEFLGSSWITRLCSKPVRNVFMQLNHGESSATEMPVYGGKYAPQIQNIDPHLEGNLHLPWHEDQNDGARHQEKTSTMSDPYFAKGTESDQKHKCKLNPIVPSSTLKKLEPVTSVFVKRLNALRQINPSRVLNAQESNLMCFFCGTTGHDMTTCPEIASSDKDLLRNVGSLDWPPASTSACVRCFRLNHWAIACPYVAVKSKCPSGSAFQNNLVNFHSELECDPKNVCFHGHDPTLLLMRDEFQRKPTSSVGVPYGESSSFQADCTDPLNFRNSAADINSSVLSTKNLQTDKLKDES